MLAILAVSDKRDIEVLAGGLVRLGWQVVATAGTRDTLAAAGCRVGRVADIAGVPAILGGRVKTLTLPVMAGILARHTESDVRELADLGIEPVELVCCNYYRLPVTAGTGELAAFRESVDIGGPAMLRAAAKNCAHVIPLTDPADYRPLLRALEAGGNRPAAVPLADRISLAEKAFRMSGEYDLAVAELFRAQCPAGTPRLATTTQAPAQAE